MFNLKALQKAIVKNMMDIANNPKKLKAMKQGDTKRAIDEAVQQLNKDAESNDPISDVDMDNIDWSKVEVIKENE